ncbi:MAG: ZPR1 zinc finger domain-containing protein [Methanomicrobiales archaeon]|nr:ZPR1 zinc finger domain-containing protein [Methanomicrobiales archaeon]
MESDPQAERKEDIMLPGICTSCGAQIVYHHHLTSIPYFSDTLIVSMTCLECGYREHDAQCLSTRSPSRYILHVKGTAELMCRVVRSTAARIIIPELGVQIDPGPACEGFISNGEGVLTRVDKVLDTVLQRDDNTEEIVARIHERKQMIRDILDGKKEMTLILEDPHGTSTIDGPDVIIEELDENHDEK